MKLDSTQRSWFFISIAIFVVCLAIYVPYALTAARGPTGGSALGLAFGIVGFAFMLFAAALGARKRVPTWRLGRAQAWMRGHLWLGLLALPLILFHGGFHFGGTLTRILMWLLIVTVASGVFGAALQNYLPRLMTRDVPLETIYDEIKHVWQLLREEADRAMERLCGPLGFTYKSEEAGQRGRLYGDTGDDCDQRCAAHVGGSERGSERCHGGGGCAGNSAVERRAVGSAAAFLLR